MAINPARLPSPKTKEEALLVMQMIEKRKAREKPRFFDELFDKQMQFILDPAKRKVAYCTRRAGKSYADGLELFNAAYYNEAVSCLYISLTRESAQRIMFKDVFHVINRKYNVGAQFNNVSLAVTLPNRSVIYSLGMDSSEEEAHKVLGQKFKKVVIDEPGSFRRDLRPIVYGVLAPAMVDLSGTISLSGTATNLTKGFFYDIVWAKTEPGWSIHQWTAYDNPYMAKKWDEEIKELKATNPHVTETPWFKQMYLNEYVVDSSQLVYKFNESRNIIERRPDDSSWDDLTYVLGVDLGFNDPSAFVVAGFSPHDSTLYLVDSYKKSGMIISDVAERIRYYQTKYNPYKIIIDNASKQAVQELVQRFSLPLTAAEKQGKAEFIEIMNSELIQGRIKSLPHLTELFDEYSGLIWDDKSTKREEHPACDNHLADACLYAWRYCYQYLSKPRPTPLSDKAKVDLWFEKEASKVMFKDEKPFWERDNE